MLTTLIGSALAGVLLASPLAVNETGVADVTSVQVPADIVADCSVDVTVALNGWMASVPDGSTLAFGPDACYRVDGKLILSDRRNIVLDGNGAKFAASIIPAPLPKREGQMWLFYGGTNITIRDMFVEGTNPTAAFDVRREWYPLIQLNGVQGAVVDGVHGSHAWGDFLSISPDTRNMKQIFPRDITLRNSSSDTIGRTAVMCNGCQDVVVDSNSFMNTGYQVWNIELEAPNWFARNISYTNNTIGGRIPLSVFVNAGIGHDVTGVLIANNVMTSTPISCESPIYILDTAPVKSNFTIRNNTLRSLGPVLRASGVSNLIVRDNLATMTRGAGCLNPGAAMMASNADGAVTNNDFREFSSLVAQSGRVRGVVCGNRLSGELFNQPKVC